MSERTPPHVSVVVPTHNSARWIAALLDTVRAQTGVTTEIVAVDDGSADDTVARLEGEPDVRVVRSPAPWKSRLIGAQAADAELVAFLDHDDLWEPNKLAKQVQALDTGVIAVGTDARAYVKRPGDAQPYPIPRLDDPYLALVRTARAIPYVISSLLTRREDAVSACLAVLGLRPQDLALHTELARRGSILRLAEPLTHYRVDPASQGHGQWERLAVEHLRTQYVFADPSRVRPISLAEFTDHHLTARMLRRAKAEAAMRQVVSLRILGDRRRAARALVAAGRADPRVAISAVGDFMRRRAGGG